MTCLTCSTSHSSELVTVVTPLAFSFFLFFFSSISVVRFSLSIFLFLYPFFQSYLAQHHCLFPIEFVVLSPHLSAALAIAFECRTRDCLVSVYGLHFLLSLSLPSLRHLSNFVSLSLYHSFLLSSHMPFNCILSSDCV